MAEGEVYESLDLALRIGEVLLSSGAGAADVSATMLAVTARLRRTPRVRGRDLRGPDASAPAQQQ